MTNENLLKKTKFIIFMSVKEKSVSCYFLFGDEIRFYILDNFYQNLWSWGGYENQDKIMIRLGPVYMTCKWDGDYWNTNVMV